MFIWAEAGGGVDIETVYHRAVARNTAFVPGRYFYAHDGEGMETMRLNFTMAEAEEIRRAVKILGEEIDRASQKKSGSVSEMS